MVDEAERVTDAATSFNSDAEKLEELRPLLATAVGFQWIDRPRTGFSARWQDFGVALGGASEQIVFFEDENKTEQRGAHHKRSVAIPVGEPYGNMQRRLARLLLCFKSLKQKLCPEWARDGAPFWAITGDDKVSQWTSQIQTDWLMTAADMVGEMPPENFTWTGYSLRSGGASAANAIGVPMAKLRHLGGWTKTRTTPEDHYIDPNVIATDAGHEFFGFYSGASR
jgi:hypothetical protein